MAYCLLDSIRGSFLALFRLVADEVGVVVPPETDDNRLFFADDGVVETTDFLWLGSKMGNSLTGVLIEVFFPP